MLDRPMESKPSPSAAAAARAKQLPPPKSPTVLRPSETGFFARWGNTILTAVLLVLAGILAYRWWSQSASNARQQVLVQLTTARQEVDELRSPQLLQYPPAQLVGQVKLVEAEVSGAVSDVINRADDATTKGRALLVRGDLNWSLANFPAVPGAATQPALRPSIPAEQYLDRASDAYAAVVALSGADAQTVAAAKLGLAYVAEDKRDWPAARSQFQAVADDKAVAVAVYAQAAADALAELPSLEQPTYVSAGGQASPVDGIVPPPATRPASRPNGPLGPPRPAALPTMPAATMPAATMPAATMPAATMPATKVPAMTSPKAVPSSTRPGR